MIKTYRARVIHNSTSTPEGSVKTKPPGVFLSSGTLKQAGTLKVSPVSAQLTAVFYTKKPETPFFSARRGV